MDLVELNRGDFIIEACCRDELQASESIQILQDIACHLAEDLTENWITSASSKLASFSELPGNYREVREINLLRLYHQEKHYFRISDLLVLHQKKSPRIPELLAAWGKILEKAESNIIEDFLNHIFDNIVPVYLYPEEARWLVSDLMNILRRVYLEHKVRWNGVEDFGNDVPNILEQAESIRDWQKWIMELSDHYIQYAQTDMNPHVALIIRKALIFIQTHFTRVLSLEEVASYTGVSKSYLCRVFPEYTGEHFSDYLQRLRIERAKELLLFTNDRIYEIAAKVGFWNSRYFSKIFHETVGLTPANYRRVLPVQES